MRKKKQIYNGQGATLPAVFSLQQSNVFVCRGSPDPAQPHMAGCRGAPRPGPRGKTSVCAVGADAPGGPIPRLLTPSVTARATKGRPYDVILSASEGSCPRCMLGNGEILRRCAPQNDRRAGTRPAPTAKKEKTDCHTSAAAQVHNDKCGRPVAAR